MDYRALNLNDFNSLNMTEAAQVDSLDTTFANLDAYVQRGRVERSMAFHQAIKSATQSVRNLFA